MLTDQLPRPQTCTPAQRGGSHPGWWLSQVSFHVGRPVVFGWPANPSHGTHSTLWQAELQLVIKQCNLQDESRQQVLPLYQSPHRPRKRRICVFQADKTGPTCVQQVISRNSVLDNCRNGASHLCEGTVGLSLQRRSDNFYTPIDNKTQATYNACVSSVSYGLVLNGHHVQLVVTFSRAFRVLGFSDLEEFRNSMPVLCTLIWVWE